MHFWINKNVPIIIAHVPHFLQNPLRIPDLLQSNTNYYRLPSQILEKQGLDPISVK